MTRRGYIARFRRSGSPARFDVHVHGHVPSPGEVINVQLHKRSGLGELRYRDATVTAIKGTTDDGATICTIQPLLNRGEDPVILSKNRKTKGKKKAPAPPAVELPDPELLSKQLHEHMAFLKSVRRPKWDY